VRNNWRKRGDHQRVASRRSHFVLVQRSVHGWK
jgi:hypothetical protein